MGKTYISVKKIQLIPQGDKDEVNRVYQYIRDGMYYQNTAYNILIQQYMLQSNEVPQKKKLQSCIGEDQENRKRMIQNTAYMMQMCLIFLLDFRLQEA